MPQPPFREGDPRASKYTVYVNTSLWALVPAFLAPVLFVEAARAAIVQMWAGAVPASVACTLVSLIVYPLVMLWAGRKVVVQATHRCVIFETHYGPIKLSSRRFSLNSASLKVSHAPVYCLRTVHAVTAQYEIGVSGKTSTRTLAMAPLADAHEIVARVRGVVETAYGVSQT